MKRTAMLICTVALLVPVASMAKDRSKPQEKPGHSEYAPGQQADKPGEAKNNAPGQLRKQKDDPNSPGASEYAPGHQSDKQHSDVRK